jgi:DNA-binding response OmpR family regulator
MARILVVEDEAKIARFVELELTHEGYEVDKAADGRTGVETALAGTYDLILLDVLLPQLNGMEVLRRIRRESDVPVIMLTARDAVMDKVAGLDAGADDYITKPFAIEELLARIRVALKRREASEHSPKAAPEPDHHVLTIKGVSLDVERYEVRVGDDVIELTNREFEVLKALMENRNIVMSRDRLVQLACGYDFVGETNIIDVYIRHLRSKIDDCYGIKLITTVRGVGYVIRED